MEWTNVGCEEMVESEKNRPECSSHRKGNTTVAVATIPVTSGKLRRLGGTKCSWAVWKALGHFGVEGKYRRKEFTHRGENFEKSSLPA
jgi:hypothetical protein